MENFYSFSTDTNAPDARAVPRPRRRPRTAGPVPPAGAPDVLTRLNVRVLGQGKPPLLCCNGFGCSQQVWRYLTAALATSHQLVLFDYPGTGETDPAAYDPAKYATLSGYADDVLAICQALDLAPAVLVGHSVGASIALLAAAAAPERFTRVVLLAATPCYLNLPGYGGGFDRADLDRLLGTFAGGDHAWANPLAHLLQGPRSPRTSMEELAGFFCEMNAVVAPQFARATFLADNRADVSRLPLPTLVLQCSHDVAVPDEVDDYWRVHLPRGTVVLLATCGHCPHLSAPAETMHAISAFLRD